MRKKLKLSFYFFCYICLKSLPFKFRSINSNFHLKQFDALNKLIILVTLSFARKAKFCIVNPLMPGGNKKVTHT